MAPYLRTLRARFSDHHRLPWLVSKLRRRLGLGEAADARAGLDELLGHSAVGG
jgi:hypothetical protein